MYAAVLDLPSAYAVVIYCNGGVNRKDIENYLSTISFELHVNVYRKEGCRKYTKPY